MSLDYTCPMCKHEVDDHGWDDIRDTGASKSGRDRGRKCIGAGLVPRCECPLTEGECSQAVLARNLKGMQ